MMSLDEFSAYVSEETFRKVGDELGIVRMETHEVKKNNGCLLHSIMPISQGNMVAPNIYVDDLYEDYKDGENIDDCVDKISTFIKEQVGTRQDLSDVINLFSDYEAVKNNLRICVVNRELNKNLLEEVPHVDVDDLALTFRVVVKKEMDGSIFTVLVRNEHMERWLVNTEELYTDAKECMARENLTRIRSMKDILLGIIPEKVEEYEEDFNKMEMYVLSNENGVNGAAEPFYNPSILQPLADKLGDLYVIPSSIHELIIVSSENMSYEEVCGMIKSVNSNEVSPDEVLGDHPYIYNAKTQELTMGEVNELIEEKPQEQNETQRRSIKRH